MRPGIRRAIVDTNWILDVALEREPGALRLWESVRRGEMELLVPGFCLTETIKTLERMRAHWDELRRRLGSHFGDLRRSAFLGPDLGPLADAAATLRLIGDEAEQRLWTVLKDVADETVSLTLDAEVISRIADIRTQLNPSPADAAVLATVVVTNEREPAAVPFLSRDAWFGRAAPARFLRDRQIPHFADAGALLAWAGA